MFNKLMKLYEFNNCIYIYKFYDYINTNKLVDTWSIKNNIQKSNVIINYYSFKDNKLKKIGSIINNVEDVYIREEVSHDGEVLLTEVYLKDGVSENDEKIKYALKLIAKRALDSVA